VDGRKLSQAEFDALYFEVQPVVLQNLLDDWPAYAHGRWDKDRIFDKYGSYPFNTSHLAPNCRILSEVHDGTLLQDHLNSGLPASWFVYPHHPMVEDMRASEDYTVPSLLRVVTANGPSVSVGLKMQGNILHDHETNWLAQVRGRKRWLVRPPGEDRYPAISRAQRMLDGPCSSPPPWPNISICVVHAGEIAYLPSNWAHETCNLDDFNVGVAYIGSAPQSWRKSAKLDSWRAAAEGNLTCVRRDNASHADKAQAWDAQVKTAGLLTPAVQNGHAAVVQWLLSQRMDPNKAADKSGGDGVAVSSQLPALHTAAFAGHAGMSELLLREGASSRQPDKSGLLPVHWASIHGHVPVLELLAKDVKDFVEHKDSNTPAITFAAANGHTGAVRHMLSRGVKINSRKSSSDASPLLAAVRDGHSLVAEILLEHKADVHARRSEDGDQAIHLAAAGASKGLVPLLGKYGADLSSRNHEGMTALHVAARAGSLEVLRWMADKKANLDEPDERGSTPAFWAAQVGHADVVKFLAERGVDMNEEAPVGFRPVSIAAAEGNDEVIRALLALDGIELDIENHGKSPREWAEERGHTKVLELLSEASPAKAKKRRRRRRRKSSKSSGDL
jgi:ankyrin repeat protein